MGFSVEARNCRANKFVIDMGTKPARPPIPGAELVITRNELMHLKQQLKPWVIVGSSVIGWEFGVASAWVATKIEVF